MSQNEMHFDVAIIGAGFSGMMVAVRLGVNPTLVSPAAK
jgi:cation diffusion facilitator CzcD-associated flavoprotein CzcO